MDRHWLPALVVLAGGAVTGSGCGGNPPVPAPPTPAAKVVVPRSTPAEPATRGATPAEATWDLTPTRVTIAPGDVGVQMLAASFSRTGERRDLTGNAEWTVEPAGVVAIEPGGYLRPIGPGRAAVRATIAGASRSAAIQVVSTSEGDRPWDFSEDVVPVLTRAGCNTGGCHGKAEGQNGFALSLFGYDPEGDHRAISRDGAGRRLNLMAPADSLLLRKATGVVPHAGGRRFTTDSSEYRTLLAWIASGATARRGETHGGLTSVRIEPGDIRLDEPGPIQLRVVATYADGHERDVTRLASFRANDDSAASIDGQGSARLLRAAETDLVVRYQSRVVSVRLGTIINPDLSFDFASLPRRNLIDDELFRRLEALRVPPSPPAPDAVFLRRVTLDLTGQQPRPHEVREFLKDDRPDKRSRKVEELLDSQDFILFWNIKLGDLLGITSARFGNGAGYYQDWAKEQLSRKAPWDEVVRTLLTAVGDPMVRGGGPANYALDGPDPKVKAEQTAQRFLGLRLRCAQCHDHPFDVWTQDDYFGLAAIFAKAGTAGGATPGMPARPVVKIDPKGQVEHLRTRQPALPRLIDGTPVVVGPADDPRKVLADWMTRPDNPYFARATANWVWAQFFGRGLAEPADDLNRANPPVHPELLDALARRFVESKFDLRDLIRTVATSEAYGLSSATIPGNERDNRLFSHHIPRPLTAHQMADALAQATDVINRFANRPSGTRAIDVWDPTSTSAILDTFGRCDRTLGCAPVANPPLSVRQMLLLIGGDVIESKVVSLNGYLANLLELDPGPDEIVENLYFRAVCRPPTEEELAFGVEQLESADSLQEAAEDLFWALLNSREFAFNH